MKKKLVPLDPVELSFDALDSSTTSQVISILCVLEKAIPEKLFREKFEELIPNYPKLNYLLKSPNWVLAENFHPQTNIHFLSLPAEMSLEAFCAKEYSKSLDSNLPPWKILIVSGNENAIHFIFHHSLADGMGIKELIVDLTDQKNEIISKTELEKDYVKRKWEAFKLVLSDLIKRTCDTPINGKNTSIRNFNLFQLPIKEINLARKHYQVSLHEYMLSLVTRSLEQYFKLYNFEIEKLNVLTPVSHRDPRRSSKLGNYITGMSTEFNLKFEFNENRLNQVKESFRHEMKEHKDELYIYLAKAVASIPEKLRKSLCNFSASKTNLICSSVPSTNRHEYEICGSRIIYKYGTVALMKGHGISIAFTRYLDNMCICLVNDPNIVSDPNNISNLMLDSHKEFYEQGILLKIN